MAPPQTKTSQPALRRSARLSKQGTTSSKYSPEGEPTDGLFDETNGHEPSQGTASVSESKGAKRRSAITSATPKAVKRAKTAPDSETAAIMLARRAMPLGKPPVWAESRQALCETLPYYRAFQSTSYHHDGYVHGLMLGKDVIDRAYLDDEVAITRAAGKCGTGDDGQFVQVMPHSYQDADVRALMNNMLHKFAIVVIVGKDNAQCPTSLPHEYNVFDHFQVTHVWSERNNGHLCIKYRLEKINLTARSWWMPCEASARPTVRDYTKKAAEQVCLSCLKPSTQVFVQCWMCLNEECTEFWKDAPQKLTYNPDFLEQRIEWPANLRPTWNLQPELPPSSKDYVLSSFCRMNWKGIVCPLCGRCNSRRRWEAWSCDTEHCGFVHQVSQPILPPFSVFKDHEVEFDGHAAPLDTIHSSITAQAPEFCDDWRITTYDLLAGNTITHFQANRNINRSYLGPDDLFKALQRTDEPIGLQRFPMKNSIGKGEVVASHFAVNFGMPYKYVVAVDSHSFAEAPQPILAALGRLEWAGRMTAGNQGFAKFNELLAVGYFEGNKMGFHDDGEKELGPTVATLSLGASAVMAIRMKERYHKGMTKGGHYDINEPVLPGSFLEHERRALNEQLVQTPSLDPAAEFLRLCKGKKPGNPKVLLEMELRHGDMVVMHGEEMQKYYEHKVEPTGKMRFALTSRFIKPQLVDANDHWKAYYEPQRMVHYDGLTVSFPLQASAEPVAAAVVASGDATPSNIDEQTTATDSAAAIPDNTAFVHVSSPLSESVSIDASAIQGLSRTPSLQQAERETIDSMITALEQSQTVITTLEQTQIIATAIEQSQIIDTPIEQSQTVHTNIGQSQSIATTHEQPQISVITPPSSL